MDSKSTPSRPAAKIRSALEISEHDPIGMEALTARYDLDVVGLSEIGCPDDVVAHLTTPERSKLSGLILPVDGRPLIVFNDHDLKQRIRSTITHEVSHHVLQHAHVARLSFGKGCTNPDADQEDEAAELGGELLIPRDAARRAAMRGRPADALAEQYEVSVEMAQWRMNMSGGVRIRKTYSRA